MIRVAALLAFILCPPPVLAETYKCTDTAGKVAYQDYPCGERSQREWQDRKRGDEKAAVDEKLRLNRAATDKAVQDINARYPPPAVTDWAAIYAGAARQQKENAALFDSLKPGDLISAVPDYILRDGRTTQTQSATHTFVDYCAKYRGRYHLHAINGVLQSKSLDPAATCD
jgi:predicted methyltransferase